MPTETEVRKALVCLTAAIGVALMLLLALR